MKTLGGALAAHLQGEVTTLATCWKATRTDGVVFGFTDHTSDLVIDGVTYGAATGYTPTAISASSRLEVSNLDVSGLLDDTAITESDLHKGLWDFAAIEIFQVNYADLSMGRLDGARGWIGEVRINRGAFVAELRGLTQALQQTIGELYSAGCRAKLGDARCKLDLTSFTFSTTVTSVTSRRQFIATALTQPAGYFDYGLVTWTSGSNAGMTMDVKTFSGGEVLLQLPMPYDIAASDAFTIVAGCQKRLTEDCKTKFNNVVNFRGEPYVPGIDKTLRGPA